MYVSFFGSKTSFVKVQSSKSILSHSADQNKCALIKIVQIKINALEALPYESIQTCLWLCCICIKQADLYAAGPDKGPL